MVKQREEDLTREDILRVIDNATAYPVMVTDASAPGTTRSGFADETQRIVDTALRSVMGGRTRVDDPEGLKAALARSFVEDRVDGRRVYRNVPRGSIADTIGEGEVSGFQGALMAHAREVVDHGLPLLAGIKSLVPITDEDDVAALASVVRSEVISLRDEFGRRDGPRPPVVKTALRNLLGKGSTTDPDRIRGAVGRLRDDLGLTAALYVSNIEDEHQLTNYRLLAEYVVGLRTAWQTASPIFGTGSGPAFVTAQLRHVELTMQTITESIDQVRTAMESVFVGEAERKIQKFDLKSLGARMTIEELLEWAEEVVAPDSVTLIREGGRIAIADSLVPTSSRILAALQEVVKLKFRGGLGASRVKKSLEDLQEQWSGLTDELKRLGSQSAVVPDVRGKRLKNARRVLRNVGLKSRADWHAADSSIVLSSNPGPGQRVRPGRIVELFVEDCSGKKASAASRSPDPGGKPSPEEHLSGEDKTEGRQGADPNVSHSRSFAQNETPATEFGRTEATSAEEEQYLESLAGDGYFASKSSAESPRVLSTDTAAPEYGTADHPVGEVGPHDLHQRDRGNDKAEFGGGEGMRDSKATSESADAGALALPVEDVYPHNPKFATDSAKADTAAQQVVNVDAAVELNAEGAEAADTSDKPSKSKKTPAKRAGTASPPPKPGSKKTDKDAAKKNGGAS